MTPIERKARELLAAEMRLLGLHEDAYPVAVGASLDGPMCAAICAIAAALTPPAGGLPELPEHTFHDSKSYTAAQLHAYALEAIAASRVGWLPIESAPKDGTRILLGRPDMDGDGGGISVAGYWLEELEDGVDYMGNDGGFTDVDYQVFQPGRSFGAESYRYVGSKPTHWQPLPAAPQVALNRGGSKEA